MPSSPTLAADQPPTAAPDTGRGRRADLIVVIVALALAVWVTSGLWRDPNQRAITVNSSDQALFEWLLAFGGHAVTHGENPLFTHLLNVPDGVNLAVNTSITVYAVVFAPLTYLIGPPATFLVILTLNLAATALAWYWLLSRRLVGSRLAAGVGALFIAFSPGMVSHANAHLNWTAGWLVPLLVWRRCSRCADPGAGWRGGLVLGVLVAVAFSIAAEGLFFTALALAVFLGVWAAAPGPPGPGPRRAAGLPARAGGHRAGRRGAAGVPAVAALRRAAAVPRHRLRPGHPRRGHRRVRRVPEPVAGRGGRAGHLAGAQPDRGEQLLRAAAAAAHRGLLRAAVATGQPGRRATLTALGVTAVVFAVLSWGPLAKWNGRRTGQLLPFGVLDNLPVVNAALPSRLALVVAPVIGLLLAYTVDRLRATPPRPGRRPGPGGSGFAVALLPLLPTPLLTSVRPPVPAVRHRRHLAAVRLTGRGAHPDPADPGRHARRPALAGVRPGPPAG